MGGSTFPALSTALDDHMGGGTVHLCRLWNRLVKGATVDVVVRLNDQQQTPGSVMLQLRWADTSSPMLQLRSASTHRGLGAAQGAAGGPLPAPPARIRPSAPSPSKLRLSPSIRRPSNLPGEVGRLIRRMSDSRSPQSRVEESDDGKEILLAELETHFRCTTTVHCVAFNASTDALAVGTNVDTELYSVHVPATHSPGVRGSGGAGAEGYAQGPQQHWDSNPLVAPLASLWPSPPAFSRSVTLGKTQEVLCRAALGTAVRGAAGRHRLRRGGERRRSWR